MYKYKALLVEDEYKLRKVLEAKINRHCPAIKISGMAENIEEAYKLIIEEKPDLVFLDIMMPGGTGFDLLERFEDISFKVIFVTGFNDYVLDAIKISAVDYILKPVMTEELVKAVTKAKAQIDNKQKIKKFELLKHNLKHLGEQETKVAIPGASAYDLVKVNDILRCEGWKKYTRIYLRERKCIVSSYNIGVFKDLFKNFAFYITHKSHLINTMHIVKYHKDGEVELTGGDRIPVSRRKREEFIQNVIKKLSI